MKLIRKIRESYFLALAFALWGAVCAIAGATWSNVLLIGVLGTKGVL